MKENIPVATIMTKSVVKLNITDSLSKAENLFKVHQIRHIPVVSKNEIVGMLSQTDLMKIGIPDFDEENEQLTSTVYNMFAIEQVMTKNVVCVTSFTTIKEVTKIFSENEFRALPVVYEGKLVGIVTTTDIIRYFLNHYNEC